MLAELQFLWSNKKLTTSYSHHVGTDGLWTTDTDLQFSAGIFGLLGKFSSETALIVWHELKKWVPAKLAGYP